MRKRMHQSTAILITVRCQSSLEQMKVKKRSQAVTKPDKHIHQCSGKRRIGSTIEWLERSKNNVITLFRHSWLDEHWCTHITNSSTRQLEIPINIFFLTSFMDGIRMVSSFVALRTCIDCKAFFAQHVYRKSWICQGFFDQNCLTKSRSTRHLVIYPLLCSANQIMIFKILPGPTTSWILLLKLEAVNLKKEAMLDSLPYELVGQILSHLGQDDGIMLNTLVLISTGWGRACLSAHLEVCKTVYHEYQLQAALDGLQLLLQWDIRRLQSLTFVFQPTYPGRYFPGICPYSKFNDVKHNELVKNLPCEESSLGQAFEHTQYSTLVP